MPIGITGDLLVPIRRPVCFGYRARPRCAGAVVVFFALRFCLVAGAAFHCPHSRPFVVAGIAFCLSPPRPSPPLFRISKAQNQKLPAQ